MNILVLNYEFPPIGGGGGAVSRDLAIMLKRRGHSVTVITMQYGDLPVKEEIEGVTVYRIKCLRKEAGVCHPHEQLTYLLSAIRFFQTHLREENFDVCHAHFIIPTGVAALYLKRHFHIPYVITAHGSDVEGYNQKRFKLMHKVLRPAWKKIVREAEAVIAPSEFLKDLMLKSDRTGCYTIIPNGIDLSYYQKLAETFCKTKSMITMCRLQEPKGVQDVIRAFAGLGRTDWVLKVVGDGPYRSELERLTEELQVTDRIIFYGWVENKSKQYERLLGESYLYLSGSRFENCPMSVLEAAAAGCRLLITDIPAHRLLLSEEKVFFPCQNVERLSEWMLEEMQAYEDKVSVHYDMEKYDWEKVCAKYEEVLKSCD